MKLGKSKFSSDKKEIFKIKDGENVFRILPPMGDLADAGVFSRYYRVIWGYKDSNGRNKPFISPRVQNYKTKMIDADCAAFNYSEGLKLKKAELVKKMKELGMNKAPITKEMKDQVVEITKEIERFNVDSKHHMNAMTEDGKIGLLKLAGRGYQAMKEVFKSLESKGVDATGIEGRFVIITRTGTGLETAYAVRELKEQVDTAEYGIVEKPIPHKLTDSIIARLSAEAYELDRIYPAPTSEEVAMIVEAYQRSEVEGGLMVDQVLGGSGDTQTKAEETVDEETGEIYQTGNAPKETKTETKAEVKTEAKVEAKAEAKAEVKKPEAKAEVKKPEAKAQAESKKEETNAESGAEGESDEDFLKKLGVSF